MDDNDAKALGLLIEVEDGSVIISEQVFNTYGEGATLPAALRDLADVLDEFAACVGECSHRSDGDAALLAKLKDWGVRK